MGQKRCGTLHCVFAGLTAADGDHSSGVNDVAGSAAAEGLALKHYQCNLHSIQPLGRSTGLFNYILANRVIHIVDLIVEKKLGCYRWDVGRVLARFVVECLMDL